MPMIHSGKERAAGCRPVILLPLVWLLSSGAMAGQTPQRTNTPDALQLTYVSFAL